MVIIEAFSGGRGRWFAIALLSCLTAELCAAEASINLGSVIVGNQEQPRVLYLLPWQQAELAENSLNLWRRQSYGVFDHESPGIWRAGWPAQKAPLTAGTSKTGID